MDPNLADKTRRTPILNGGDYAPAIRHLAEQRRFDDPLIAAVLGIGTDQVKHIRAGHNIRAGAGRGQPTADRILNALRDLIDDPRERAVAERFDRLRKAGLSFEAALRAARAGDESDLSHGVYVGLRTMQDQAA